MRDSLRLRLLPPLAALALAACARPAPAPQTGLAADPASQRAVTTGRTASPVVYTENLHWLRASAEYRAIVVQTYRAALAAAERLSAGRAPGSWGVSVDADETILDNSGYEKRLQERGAAFADETWGEWIRSGERGAVPGAVAFLAGVRALGGKVAVVTNTKNELCTHVEADLERLGLAYDVVLCRHRDEERKEGRWRRLADGSAAPGVAPMELLVFVGDNIHDFPDETQALRDAPDAALAAFGVRYFVLPNPIYGTWEVNPPR